jgi:type I restriction enzyme R subunit
MGVAVLYESDVEEASLSWLMSLSVTVLHGPDIAPDTANAERISYGEVLLIGRLQTALARLNPDIPAETLEEALRKVQHIYSPNLIEANHRFHQMLIDGVDVEYQAEDGRPIYKKVALLDFENPDNNDWLAVNQFTIIEHKHNRRPDVVLFVNGLPLVVIELKNAADENATIRGAFNQIQTYKRDIPGLFVYNEVCVVSDGLEARAGTLTADWERFMPWRTIDGTELAPRGSLELETLVKGIFERQRFLEVLRYFSVFETDEARIEKKLAGYHQFHAVQKAVTSTLNAVAADRRGGVVWHTQGSGKSLTMAFYAGRMIQHPQMENPTLVVITDRNDLDDQLFGTFAACYELLRQRPVQAESRDHLAELLQVASGGVVFTTIQKFLPADQRADPKFTDRRDVIVIADEAHRSQYDFIDGFARNMRLALPQATFIAFTGTPIESADRSTKAVFGDYIDIYDIQQAVEDGATVPIYYEARHAALALSDKERPHIDPDFEEVTEGEEQFRREALKSRWARLEALVGSEKRVKLVASDIVAHFEKRLEALEGKAMIVCMSRRICVALYDAIIALRPDWHDDDDNAGAIKVVMTGSAADPQPFQPHVRNKARREALANRFKNPDDPLKLVIVRDMWLTGFDAPCLHTMYLDKPMRGHGLMQAIARVNRVFKDKPGGLVVGYLPLAQQLKDALAEYTEGARGNTGIPQEEALAILLQKHAEATALFKGFDYTPFYKGTPAERLAVLPRAMEHILKQKDGKNRLIQVVTELSKSFALAVPHAQALAIRDEVGFFQAIRAAFLKNTSSGNKTGEDLDSAIQHLVSKAVEPEGIIDVFAAAGLEKPDIAILSDEFLEEVRHLPQRNLALELLQKLINDQIRVQSRRNVVQGRSFAAMLEQSVRSYQNRTIEAAQLMAALIDLAKSIRAARERGQMLNLTDDELAFYDALDAQDDAVQALGDEALRTIARELLKTIRNNVTIDWTVKENVRANLRRLVKRILRQYGYPPEMQERATVTILEQAEALSRDWAA